jgi:hypothetical protein
MGIWKRPSLGTENNAGYVLIAADTDTPAATLVDIHSGEVMALEHDSAKQYNDLTLFREFAGKASRRWLLKVHRDTILIPHPLSHHATAIEAFEILHGRKPPSLERQHLLPIDGDMMWETTPSLEQIDLILDFQAVFIHSCALAARAVDGHCGFFQVKAGRLYICIFRQGLLQFQNSFAFEHTEDLLYFVLLGVESFGIQKGAIQWFGCGETALLDSGLVEDYIGEWQPLPHRVAIDPALPAALVLRHHTLLNAILCAS